MMDTPCDAEVSRWLRIVGQPFALASNRGATPTKRKDEPRDSTGVSFRLRSSHRRYVQQTPSMTRFQRNTGMA